MLELELTWPLFVQTVIEFKFTYAPWKIGPIFVISGPFSRC